MTCLELLKGRAMRALAGIGLVALTAQPAFADQCLRQAEKTAFNMRVLQSELMIAALQCGQHTQYNRFMQSHQTELSTAYDRIGAHFARLYGAAGDEQRDSYITDLANAQAQDQLQQGPGFCSRVGPLVNVSLTLTTIEGMSNFVQEQHLINPYAPPDCTPDHAVSISSAGGLSDRRTIQPVQAPSMAGPTYVLPMPAVGEPLKLLRVPLANHG